MEIRAARPADAERLTSIAHSAKRHWGYPEGLIELWDDELTVSPEFITGHDVYVAERGPDVLGFYALSRDTDAFELEHMWVDPDHIGEGVGALLFEHAVTTARSSGASVLRIASDPNAVGFYQKMGARPVGVVPSRPEGRTLPLLTLVLQ